jgi:hypothetical protein
MGSVAAHDSPDRTPDSPLWDAVAGSDGVGYLIEAVPAGTFCRGWGDLAPASDPEAIGLLLALGSLVVMGAVNLVGRLVHGFKWELRVSRPRARWPHGRKTVRRERFDSKAEAITALPLLADEIRTSAP